MTLAAITGRDAVLRRFTDLCTALFAERPERRSVLLAVAQYWNDQADDEVHGRIVISTRDTPAWPHECDYDPSDETYTVVPALPSDVCESCGHTAHELAFYGGYGDDTVAAVELFCTEGASQNMDDADAYMPWVIARRHGGHVELEQVGRPQRPATTLLGVGAQAPEPWAVPEARALFDEVCRHPDDDGPRVVLSDHLLEAADVRGEAIALALVRAPDAATRARHDALLADHLVDWIHPLGAVIPPTCAVFERGFLTRAHVYARDPAAIAAVRGAAAWGTVEELSFIPGSAQLIDPAMRALRDVGPLTHLGVTQLCEAAQPWRIERLHVIDDERAPYAFAHQLARATTLPALRHLVISANDVAWLDQVHAVLAATPWWPQLTRLTLIRGVLDVLPHGRRYRPAGGWLALADDGFHASPAGWQVAFGPRDEIELSMPGWDGDGTLRRLVEIVGQLPATARLRLVSTRARLLGAEEAAYLREHAGRDVEIA